MWPLLLWEALDSKKSSFVSEIMSLKGGINGERQWLIKIENAQISEFRYD